MTDLFSQMDSWDFIAAGMLAVCLILLCGGIGVLSRANPDSVDAGKLKNRALGGALVSAAYLICRFLS